MMNITTDNYYKVTKNSSDDMFKKGDAFYLDDDNDMFVIDGETSSTTVYSEDQRENMCMDFEYEIDDTMELVPFKPGEPYIWAKKGRYKLNPVKIVDSNEDDEVEEECSFGDIYTP